MILAITPIQPVKDWEPTSVTTIKHIAAEAITVITLLIFPHLRSARVMRIGISRAAYDPI